MADCCSLQLRKGSEPDASDEGQVKAEWPEVTIYANGKVEDTSGFEAIRLHEKPEERYVPLSRLTQLLTALEHLHLEVSVDEDDPNVHKISQEQAEVDARRLGEIIEKFKEGRGCEAD